MSQPAPSTVPAASLDERVGVFLQDNGSRLMRVLTEHESVFTAKDVQRTLSRVGDWNIDRSTLDPSVDKKFAEAIQNRMLGDPTLLTRFEDTTSGRALYTTPQMLDMETTLVETARAWREGGPSVSEEITQKALDKFQAWHDEMGFGMDPNMLDAMRDMLGPNRVNLLDAPPGAGKSTAAKGLSFAYQMSGTPMMVVGPSDVITSELMGDTQAGKGETLRELINKVRRGENPIDEGSAIIVDEAGMIGTRDMKTLFDAAAEKGAKLHLIGDGRQIAPQAAGQPFRVFCEQLDHVSLTQTFRQKKPEDREITLQLWHGQMEQAIDTLEDRGSIHRRGGMSNVLKEVANQYADWYERNQDTGKVGLALALGPDNADEINLRVRDALKARDMLEHGRSYETTGGTLELAQGDRVILTQDAVDMGGAREPKKETAGATGQVVKVSKDGIEIKIDKSKAPPLTIAADDKVPLAHAYALDLSRIQGISVDQAFTAVTRPFEYGEALVALSRHKTNAITTLDEDVYPTRASLKRQLEQIRPKETAMDLALNPDRYRPTAAAAPR